jgi:hypothetical protein
MCCVSELFSRKMRRKRKLVSRSICDSRESIEGLFFALIRASNMYLNDIEHFKLGKAQINGKQNQ